MYCFVNFHFGNFRFTAKVLLLFILEKQGYGGTKIEIPALMSKSYANSLEWCNTTETCG